MKSGQVMTFDFGLQFIGDVLCLWVFRKFEGTQNRCLGSLKNKNDHIIITYILTYRDSLFITCLCQHLSNEVTRGPPGGLQLPNTSGPPVTCHVSRESRTTLLS